MANNDEVFGDFCWLRKLFNITLKLRNLLVCEHSSFFLIVDEISWKLFLKSNLEFPNLKTTNP